MITLTNIAREKFEQERRRLGRPNLGIQVGFLYGCGGAGFRVTFTDDLSSSQVLLEHAGICIGLDAESRDALQGALIDWEDGPGGGFILRHADAALVEFC